jgi:hypothetical protein
MGKINDGGPAFPGDMPTVQLDGNKLPFAPGMSLRDWFAGEAQMPPDGISQTWAEAVMGEKAPDWLLDDKLDCVRWWSTAEARARYIAADAMLAERAKAEG